jgi:DNA polymerase IV
MNAERIILLVDMNAFFASVEQQCNPLLRGKPTLVGGACGKRSVVAAASYEARPFGIRSGMSMFEALKLCPDAIVVEGNPHKYVDVAHKVFRICENYTDAMEIYSIDECFLDVTDTCERFGGPWEIARAIKRRIRADLRLTCSVGIAPNKMLAKLAADMQKPDGLVEIKRDEVKELLENLPVEELHGIGGRMREHLAKMGIFTGGDLGRAPVAELKRRFGISGDVFHQMGTGTYFSPIIPHHSRPDAKSMGHSYTLERNTRDINLIHRHLLRLSEMVGRRLREDGYCGRTITLTLRYANMHTFCRQRSIIDSLDDGYDIYLAALPILRRQLAKDKRAVRLVGISISNLMRSRQLDLFANPHKREVLSVVDAVNDRYGEFTLKRASLLNLSVREKTHGFEGKELE